MSIGAGIFRGHLITLRRFLLTFWRDIRAGNGLKRRGGGTLLRRPVPLTAPRQRTHDPARTTRPTGFSRSSTPTSGCRCTSGFACCRC